jgi:hypothetical protein
MEKTKYNQAKEILDEIARHEIDLTPDADKDPVGKEEASVAVQEVAKEEKQPLPELGEHPDGHKNPEKLEALQCDLDRIQTIKRASRVHEYFTAIESKGECKSTPVMTRSQSAERLSLGAYQIQPAQVKITLRIGGNR